MDENKDIISRMNDKFMKMSKGHKAIAAFISDHYDEAAFLTAAKIGQTVGVSESTVVRFATGLGYDGYPLLSEKQRQKLFRQRVLQKQRLWRRKPKP